MPGLFLLTGLGLVPGSFALTIILFEGRLSFPKAPRG
jgi:hypothetical protein